MLKIAVASAIILTALAARLHAQDSALWRYTADEEISFYRVSPLGHLIVSEKNRLVAVDPRTGEPAWIRDDIQNLAPSDFKFIPFMPVALVSSGDGIGWIDLAVGTDWSNSSTFPLLSIYWHLVVPQHRLLLLFGVSGESLSTLVAIDILTGEVRWRHDNVLRPPADSSPTHNRSLDDGLGSVYQPPVVDTDTTLILYASRDGPVKLHAGTGELLWRVAALSGKPPSMLSAAYAPMLYHDGLLFVPFENALVAIKASDGSIAWERHRVFRSRIAQMIVTRLGLLLLGVTPPGSTEPAADASLDLVRFESGTSIWRQPYTGLFRDARFGLSGDTIYLVIPFGELGQDIVTEVIDSVRGQLVRGCGELGLVESLICFGVASSLKTTNRTVEHDFFAVDLRDGSSQQVVRFTFDGGETPKVVQTIGDELLLYSSQNFLLLDRRGTVKYHRYYRVPGPKFFEDLVVNALVSAGGAVLFTYVLFPVIDVVMLGLGTVALNVAGLAHAAVAAPTEFLYTGRASFHFRIMDFEEVDRGVQAACRQRGGTFCDGVDFGQLWIEGFALLMLEEQERFGATVDAVNYAYVYTNEPLGDRKGHSIVRLDKTDGEETGRVWIDRREPDFSVDPVSGIVFVKESATEISAHQFPPLSDVMFVDRDEGPEAPISRDSLPSIAETREDVERPIQRVVAVTSSFEADTQLHGSGVWVAQEQDEVYVAVPLHLVRGGPDGATVVGVQVQFADGEAYPAALVDSIDEAMGLAVLRVDSVELQRVPSNNSDPRQLGIGAVTYIMDYAIDGADGELIEAGTVSSRDGLFIEVSVSRSSHRTPRIPRGGNLRFNAAAGIATAVGPHDPAKVYAGSQAVHQSTDKGQTWVEISPDLTLGEGAISTIAPSPVDPRVVWVGSDDGLIQITRRGGRIWTRFTPRGHENGQVVHIRASPTDAGAALAFFRDADQPNATLRVMATSSYGREWEQVEPGDLHSSREGSGAVGGGLFDSDRRLIGLVVSRDDQKITALRIDVVLEWLRSRSYSPSSRD